MGTLGFNNVCVIDIDGLKPQVLSDALREGALPNFRRLFGNTGEQQVTVPVVAPAPSITFPGQLTITTGQHPKDHGISGNDFLDRQGLLSDGVARHYGLDGSSGKVWQPVQVFMEGLADTLISPDVQTIFDLARRRGTSSLAVHHIYGRGADIVKRPTILELARFAKGVGFLKLTPEAYDQRMLDKVRHGLDEAGTGPLLLVAYFMGADSWAHKHGAERQGEYVTGTLDRQIGSLLDMLEHRKLFDETLFVLASDHGQISTPGTHRHAIEVGVWNKELGLIFEDAGLNILDWLHECPSVTDAVVGLNGGLAHVYLRKRDASWGDFPRFEYDVLPIADRLHRMTTRGDFGEDFRNSLDAIFIRNAERGGWGEPYSVYRGDGRVQPIAEWLLEHPQIDYVDAYHRLRLAACSKSGDLILAANTRRGIYFGSEGLRGVHGSLDRGDSEAVLRFCAPTATARDMQVLEATVIERVTTRCQQEGGRQPSTADMLTTLERVW